MPEPIGPIETFRIRPEGRRLFIDVYIWPDREALVAHSRRLYGRLPRDEELRAFNAPLRLFLVSPDGRKRLAPMIGEINFVRDDIGAGIVSHEMTHAALAWARRVRLDVGESPADPRMVADSEERFCLVLGELVRQFYCWAQRLGLY